MIFDTTMLDWKTNESYKERNLYYKIFGGYLFNELIEGYENRKKAFLNMLEENINKSERFFGEAPKANTIIKEIQEAPLHVTFDYHPAQIFIEYKRNNRGEMSDILLHSGQHIISIECKFLSNIGFKKDIEAVHERIIKFSEHFKILPLQVLLLKEKKWNSTKLIKEELKKSLRVPVVVLFWEDLRSLISNYKVLQYLNVQIDRKSSMVL